MTFDEKVKAVRMRLFLSQAELANQLGVSLATVCRWEKCKRQPQIASQGKFYAFCKKNNIKFEN